MTAVLLFVSTALAQESASLLDNVVDVLRKRYYDSGFRSEFPKIAEDYRENARDAVTIAEQRNAAHDYLENVPVSHLAIFSKASYRRMLNELMNRKAPTYGFEITEIDGFFYVYAMLEGGPAEKAGLLRGDRILTIDEAPPADSPLLDWRTDDAYLDDPARHVLLAMGGDRVNLEIERTPDEFLSIEIAVDSYSAFEAAKESARILEHDGVQIGYIHFWFVHMSGNRELLERKMNGELAEADALIIDLRGRGGSATEIGGIVRTLERWSKDRPVVALMDHQTRSAKEVIADSLRNEEIATLVGETTAGAVIPATFAEVGFDTILMFPSFTMSGYTSRLEGHGVEPHVPAAAPGPYSAGGDPILEAGLAEASRQVNEAQAY